MKRQPRCRKCGNKTFRKSGIKPTAFPTSKQIKGYHGPPGNKGRRYFPEALNRLFVGYHACLKCGHRMRLGEQY